MKELELQLRIKNNRLKERREKLGYTAKAFAQKLNIGYTKYCAYENLKIGENNKSNTVYIFNRRDYLEDKKGDWNRDVKKIAEFYNVEPSELFPASTMLIEYNTITKKVDSEELTPILSGSCDQLLPAEISNSQEKKIIIDERNKMIENALSTLTPMEKRNILWSFGLNGEDEKSLDEIGNNYCLSRERVRQIKLKACEKLHIYFSYNATMEFYKNKINLNTLFKDLRKIIFSNKDFIQKRITRTLFDKHIYLLGDLISTPRWFLRSILYTYDIKQIESTLIDMDHKIEELDISLWRDMYDKHQANINKLIQNETFDRLRT